MMKGPYSLVAILAEHAFGGAKERVATMLPNATLPDPFTALWSP